MKKIHNYNITVQWTGNKGEGTKDYQSYDRCHSIIINEKQDIHCSSDPVFKGDKTKHNPEELFLASISSCHMLWYLHLCADNNIVVLKYTDKATASMQVNENGGGHFTEVILHPIVTITDNTLIEKANALHKKANALCFIANSCNFVIHHKATCIVVSFDTK